MKPTTRLELWKSSRWIYFKHVTKMIFLGADTSTIRLILAWASLLWAATLVWSMLTGAPAFQRPFYSLMAWWGNEWVWAAAFTLHFFGVHWRLFDLNPRPLWAWWINLLGLSLWFVSTLSTTLMAPIKFTPGTMLEWTMCAASAWALYRTGLKRELLTP